MRIEWDGRKNDSNRLKHGVAFEVAATVFNDPLCVSLLDRIADGEQRWQTFGTVAEVLLMVAHTLDEQANGEEFVRIISARRATANERRRYEQEDD